MEIQENLTEFLIMILLVAGLLLSLAAGSVALNYVIIILCGLFFGRQFYIREKKRKGMFKFYLVIAAFLVGYIIGSYYANTLLILLFFLIGICVSYWIHSNIFK